MIWLAALAFAAPPKGRKQGPVEVPIDVGVGPAANLLFGPVFQEQPALGGIALSIEAVLDKKTIRKFKSRIPGKYRKMAMNLDEVRISHPLIPHGIFLSPVGVGGSTVGMYGAVFEPVSIGMPLVKDPFSVRLGVGLVLTYAYVHSKELPSPTHFLRPGIDPGIEIDLPFSDRFLVSFGWESQLYLPQPVGGGVLEVGPLDEAIWHVGAGFVKLHFRFPIEVRP